MLRLAVDDPVVHQERPPGGVDWEVYGDWDDDPRKRPADVYVLLTPGSSGDSGSIRTAPHSSPITVTQGSWRPSHPRAGTAAGFVNLAK